MTIEILLIMDVVSLSNDQKKDLVDKSIEYIFLGRKASRILVDIITDDSNIQWLRTNLAAYNPDVIRVRKQDGEEFDPINYPKDSTKYNTIRSGFPEHQYMGWPIPSK